MFAISESWLNSTHADAEVCIVDYQLHRHDREFSHRGGGTAIYVKNTIICSTVYPLHNTAGISIDYVCLRDKFEARAKHNLPANVIYKRIRNDVVKQITDAKSNYIKQKI